MSLNSDRASRFVITQIMREACEKCTKHVQICNFNSIFTCWSGFSACQITTHTHTHVIEMKTEKNCVTLNWTLIKCAHILYGVCLTGQSLRNYRIPIIQLERVIFFIQRVQNKCTPHTQCAWRESETIKASIVEFSRVLGFFLSMLLLFLRRTMPQSILHSVRQKYAPFYMKNKMGLATTCPDCAEYMMAKRIKMRSITRPKWLCIRLNSIIANYNP